MISQQHTQLNREFDPGKATAHIATTIKQVRVLTPILAFLMLSRTGPAEVVVTEIPKPFKDCLRATLWLNDKNPDRKDWPGTSLPPYELVEVGPPILG